MTDSARARPQARTAPEPRKRGGRRSGRDPTIADVARAAGVSPMTVSRVVNKVPHVVPETRARVEAAIAEVGYVPNQAARALAGGQQCRIALLHDNPSALWLSAVLVATMAEANRIDAQLIVECCDDPADAAGLVGHLVAHRIDGVILPPPMCDNAELLAQLRAAAIHMVLLSSGMPAKAVDAVGIDEQQGARDMTAHLIAQGHRRIGFICGNPDQSASMLRLAGFREALADAGLAGDDGLIAGGDFSFASGLEAAERLLSLPQPPSAIFASNDDMAAAVVAAAHRKHLLVPEDISVCGFDDTAIATMVWPQLTTVRQPIAELGGSATRLLVEAIRAQRSGEARAPVQSWLRHAVIARGSVCRLDGERDKSD